MKRYPDCIKTDEMCDQCSLTSRGLDCHNNKINSIRWKRKAAGMTQQELASAAGINIRYVQRYEKGECDLGNMTLNTALALSKALKCEPNDLL